MLTRLPETPPAERRIPFRPADLGVAVRTVVRSRFTAGLTLAQVAALGFVTSYLAAAVLLLAYSMLANLNSAAMAPWVVAGTASAFIGGAALIAHRWADVTWPTSVDNETARLAPE